MGTWGHPSERRCGAKRRNCIQCLGCAQCSPCPRADFVPKQFLIRGLLLEGPSSSGAIIFLWGHHLPLGPSSITNNFHHGHLSPQPPPTGDICHQGRLPPIRDVIFHHSHFLPWPSAIRAISIPFIELFSSSIPWSRQQPWSPHVPAHTRHT